MSQSSLVLELKIAQQAYGEMVEAREVSPCTWGIAVAAETGRVAALHPDYEAHDIMDAVVSRLRLDGENGEPPAMVEELNIMSRCAEKIVASRVREA